MTSLEIFDGMNIVHPTMPGQAVLAVALGNACGFTHSDAHDLCEMLLASFYTFVGWYIMSRLLQRPKRLAAAKVKDMCPIDLDYSDDELEEVKDAEEWSLECDQISSVIVPGKRQSTGMAPLECYDAFGAGPGSWALPRDERPEPKCGVAKPNLGMALLEQYGVFGAAPGAWDFPQHDSAAKASDMCPIDLDYSDDELEEVKDEEDWSLECDLISSGIVPGKHQSTGMAPLECYDAFGAGPGSWALPRDQRPEPKGGVDKPNLGMALLEHYGVFGAAPGAWEYPQYES